MDGGHAHPTNMLNNRFPISTPLPRQDDDAGKTTKSSKSSKSSRSSRDSSPPPRDYWTHYQRQRHHHYSNQRHHQQYCGQMENNRHQQHPKQSKSGIRDPNNIPHQHRGRQSHPHPQQQQLLPSPAVVIGGLAGGRSDGGDDGNGYDRMAAITKPSIEGRKGNYRTKAKAFIIEFLQGASLHGFIYLSKVGLHFVERVLWLVFICIAFFGVVSLSHRTWERFQTSPMVISMDRNKLVWNTSFPSLTVCPHKRVDENKVEEFLQIHKQNFPTEEDKEDFRVFIEKLASLSYDNIESLPMNKTFSIPSAKYLDILFELKWNFEPELSSGTTVKMNIYQTITELGICNSVNTLVGQYSSYDYWQNNEWGLLDHGDRVTVHPLDGEIYAQIINLSTGYDVYFHSAADIPNMSKQRYTFPESDYTTVELIALETFTTPRAKELNIRQRKCRFSHEADEMMTVPIYSYGLCLTECRMKLALRVCKCVPHFYRNRDQIQLSPPANDGNFCLFCKQIPIDTIEHPNKKITIRPLWLHCKINYLWYPWFDVSLNTCIRHKANFVTYVCMKTVKSVSCITGYLLPLCGHFCHFLMNFSIIPHPRRGSTKHLNEISFNNSEPKADFTNYNPLKGGRILPVCDFNGLSCLAQIKKEIISLKSDTLSIDCKCLANCDDSNFFVQSHRSRVWFLGANLQWGIIDYPKMQLRRDVLFSFADVLVYIGGLAGFFLGCSILTFTEIIYFFTARFLRRLFC